MSFLDGAKDFLDKFGFFGGEEDLGTDEGMDDQEPDEPDEDEETSFLGRWLGFRGRSAVQSDEDERLVRAHEERKPAAPDNVIRDERMTGRAAVQTASHSRHVEHIVQVHAIEECREIIQALSKGETILLNLENVDPKDCGRIVDLLSGAAYALEGKMLKAAHLCYLLAPQSVQIITSRAARPQMNSRSL